MKWHMKFTKGKECRITVKSNKSWKADERKTRARRGFPEHGGKATILQKRSHWDESIMIHIGIYAKVVDSTGSGTDELTEAEPHLIHVHKKRLAENLYLDTHMQVLKSNVHSARKARTRRLS